jgi:hypothetical protein
MVYVHADFGSLRHLASLLTIAIMVYVHADFGSLRHLALF